MSEFIIFWISITTMIAVTYVPTIIKSYQTTKNDRRVINLEAEVKHLKDVIKIYEKSADTNYRTLDKAINMIKKQIY